MCEPQRKEEGPAADAVGRTRPPVWEGRLSSMTIAWESLHAHGLGPEHLRCRSLVSRFLNSK